MRKNYINGRIKQKYFLRLTTPVVARRLKSVQNQNYRAPPTKENLGNLKIKMARGQVYLFPKRHVPLHAAPRRAPQIALHSVQTLNRCHPRLKTYARRGQEFVEIWIFRATIRSRPTVFRIRSFATTLFSPSPFSFSFQQFHEALAR